MIVISNSGPLIALSSVDQLDILFVAQRILGHYGNLRADERRQSTSAEFNEFKGEQDINQSKIRFPMAPMARIRENLLRGNTDVTESNWEALSNYRHALLVMRSLTTRSTSQSSTCKRARS